MYFAEFKHPQSNGGGGSELTMQMQLDL